MKGTNSNYNKVFHSAVLIRDLHTGEVVVYQGNIPCEMDLRWCYNDMANSLRSLGSILKPFLYAALLQGRCELQPKQMVADIPL